MERRNNLWLILWWPTAGGAGSGEKKCKMNQLLEVGQALTE